MEKEIITDNERTGPVTLIYWLLLAGIVLPLVSIVGVIIAYVYRSDAADWLQQHYRFQIRTFWIGVLIGIAALILTTVVIGYLVYLFLLIWIIVRCVKGLKTLGNQTPPAKPGTWLF